MLVELACGICAERAAFNSIFSDGGVVIAIDLEGDIQTSILY